MPKAPKLTKENVVEIVKRRKNGEQLNNIALRFGVSEQHIGKIMNGKKCQKWTNGILPPIQDSRFKLSDIQVKEVIKLRHQEWTQQQIADRFGVSQGVIAVICQGKRRKNISADIDYTFTCKYCGDKFKKKYNVQLFCSQHCRLWFNIDQKPFKINQSFCYPWKLDQDKDGYGQISWKDDNGKIKNERAHRMVLEEKLGRMIKEGMHACHTCDNPICCNPRHLYEGTPKRNKQDSVDRNRHVYGEKSGTHKLTEKEVKQIIEGLDMGISHNGLASLFNVAAGTIWFIEKRRTWKHISRN